MRRRSSETEPSRSGRKHGERSKISLLQVFRAAHEDHDARKRAEKTGDQESQITSRSKQRREGVSETVLREHIRFDLASLLNTTQLDSTESLEDYPHVARSIVNYGFPDFSLLSKNELDRPDVLDAIRQCIIDFEPRINPATIEVKLENPDGDERGHLAFHINGDLISDPVDIPIDFEAEVDLGKGKLNMTQLKV